MHSNHLGNTLKFFKVQIYRGHAHGFYTSVTPPTEVCVKNWLKLLSIKSYIKEKGSASNFNFIGKPCETQSPLTHTATGKILKRKINS